MVLGKVTLFPFLGCLKISIIKGCKVILNKMAGLKDFSILGVKQQKKLLLMWFLQTMKTVIMDIS
jgi:hypothetical protein